MCNHLVGRAKKAGSYHTNGIACHYCNYISRTIIRTDYMHYDTWEYRMTHRKTYFFDHDGNLIRNIYFNIPLYKNRKLLKRYLTDACFFHKFPEICSVEVFVGDKLIYSISK